MGDIRTAAPSQAARRINVHGIVALTAAGVPTDANPAVVAGWSVEAGYDATAAWRRLANAPTVACVRCDTAALSGLAAAHHAIPHGEAMRYHRRNGALTNW